MKHAAEFLPREQGEEGFELMILKLPIFRSSDLPVNYLRNETRARFVGTADSHLTLRVLEPVEIGRGPASRPVAACVDADHGTREVHLAVF